MSIKIKYAIIAASLIGITFFDIVNFSNLLAPLNTVLLIHLALGDTE